MAFYHKHIKDAKALFPAFQVLLYQPQYSCHPPAIIILMFSVLQVKRFEMNYLSFKAICCSGYILHLAQSVHIQPGLGPHIVKPSPGLLCPHLQPHQETRGLEVPHLPVCPRQHGAHRVQHTDAAGRGSPLGDVSARIQGHYQVNILHS